MSFLVRARRSLRGCKPNFSFGICLFQEEFCLDLFGFLIAIPFMDRWHREPKEIMEKWGFGWFESSLALNWGDYTKHLYAPWMWDHCIHEVRRPDGSWVKYVGSYERDKEPDGREVQQFPYRYTLRSGEVQERIATVYVERRTWKWRWFSFLPWPKLIRQSIDIAFSDEVGERTGSWKGGCIGCGWDMLDGETMEQTLLRMQATREFK